jgi:uncharacterized iron-regulated membrane protein
MSVTGVLLAFETQIVDLAERGFRTKSPGGAGGLDLRVMLTLDPRTGEIVKKEPFSNYNLGRRLRMWARWAHTGEAAGLAGQFVAGLASAGAAILVWTGGALSCRRFFWRRKS